MKFPIKILTLNSNEPPTGLPTKGTCQVNHQSIPTNLATSTSKLAAQLTTTLLNVNEILKKLGDGTFGRVLEVEDLESKRVYAMKVIRPIERYIHSAKVEGKILEEVSRFYGKGSELVIRMKERFSFMNKDSQTFYALVFEKCGSSLYEFIKSNNYRGLSINRIRTIAHELLQALHFLHSQVKLIHTDLKVPV